MDIANGGSVEGYIGTIGAVLDMIPADTKNVPGHGPVATVADLKNYHQMLVEAVEAVRKAKAQGKTLDEIRRTRLPEKWRQAGGRAQNADFWIETV